MRHFSSVCLALVILLSGCAGATEKTVALAQAHDVYFERFADSKAGVIAESGLLFIKVSIEWNKKVSRKAHERKALSKAKKTLVDFLREERKKSFNSLSFSQLPSRVLVNRRESNRHIYVLAIEEKSLVSL